MINPKIDKKYVTFEREPFFEIVEEYLNDNSRVLDIGAGNGNFADFFKRKDFYLFDGNEETVSRLKKRFQFVNSGKLPKLPYENSFFDIIHCSHVVEHLEPEDLYQTIMEMDRCLKQKGKIIISTPLYWEGFYDDLSHVKPYNPNVFLHYLVKENRKSRTREIISFNYKLIKIVYRYREIFDWTFYKNAIYRNLRRVLQRFTKKYEKTGYTIVLEKELNETSKKKFFQ